MGMGHVPYPPREVERLYRSPDVDECNSNILIPSSMYTLYSILS